MGSKEGEKLKEREEEWRGREGKGVYRAGSWIPSPLPSLPVIPNPVYFHLLVLV